MKTTAFKFVFILLLLSLCYVNAASAANYLDENRALDVLLKQIKKDRLYDSWTSIPCLSFVTEEETKNYFIFAIHEKHGGNCPGDPASNPVVDRFRVNRVNRLIQWNNLISDKYVPYKTVLKARLKR